MKNALLLPLLLCTQLVMAADAGGSENIEGREVPHTLMIDTIKLEKIGAGVRFKRSWGMNWPVYIAAVYASNPQDFVRNTDGFVALESMLKMRSFAIQLQLLRDVKASAMVEGFEAALKVNQAQDSEALRKFKEMLLSREFLLDGDKVTIAFNNEANNKSIVCEQNGKDKVQIPADEKVFKDILSIWLGTPVDEQIGLLRSKLIQR